MTPSKPAPGRLEGLGTAVAMAVCLLVLSFSRIAGDTGSLGFASLRENVLDSALSRPIWETRLGRNVMLFVGALLLVHLAFALVAWALGRLSAIHWRRVEPSAWKWAAAWSLMLAIWVLVANASWYPLSSLGAPYEAAMRAAWHGIRAIHVVSALVLLAATVLLAEAAWAWARARRRGHLVVAGSIAAAIAVVPAFLILKAHAAPHAQGIGAKPNVIIIGIDSLRCDAVRRDAGGATPAIDEFLSQAAFFTDAMTPLARTFGSWVSIITGRHPHTTGALVNLLPRDMIHAGDTLPMMASRAGYQTVYAIDEVRFSNLDASYGFDRTITPPMGATDFALGFFGDTPLSNLLVNTWLGEYLFPYAHGNRAAFKTYDPDTLVARLDRELDFSGPTMLTLHLTLVHWPYTWSDAADAENVPLGAPAGSGKYASAVARVDRQFRDVMDMLERHGALRNAIVVLLSDHGEALGQPGDSLIPENGIDGLELAERGRVLGHGTSVLSPHQYRVVLGMRTYGGSIQPGLNARTIGAPVSLEDLTPTLADLLGLSPRERFDGRSLAPLLSNSAGAEPELNGRIRFTESEFNPPGISMADPTANKSAIAEASRYYEVDPVTDRVLIRRDKLDTILSSRQYAAIRGDLLLAAVPGQLSGEHHFLVVDRRRGLPRRLMGPPDRTRDPDLAQMWDALHARFGSQFVVKPATLPTTGDHAPSGHGTT